MNSNLHKKKQLSFKNIQQKKFEKMAYSTYQFAMKKGNVVYIVNQLRKMRCLTLSKQ